jgi:hypothetical protein
MNKWKPLGVVTEGESILLDGINLWGKSWVRLEQPAVKLPHPSYPNQEHQLSVFQVTENGKVLTFASGELSANVWGFYVPV